MKWLLLYLFYLALYVALQSEVPASFAYIIGRGPRTTYSPEAGRPPSNSTFSEASTYDYVPRGRGYSSPLMHTQCPTRKTMHAGQSGTRMKMSGRAEEIESNHSSYGHTYRYLFDARCRIVAQAGGASRWGPQEVDRAALNAGMPVGIRLLMQDDDDDLLQRVQSHHVAATVGQYQERTTVDGSMRSSSFPNQATPTATQQLISRQTGPPVSRTRQNSRINNERLFQARNRVVVEAGEKSRWGFQEVEKAALSAAMPVPEMSAPSSAARQATKAGSSYLDSTSRPASLDSSNEAPWKSVREGGGSFAADGTANAQPTYSLDPSIPTAGISSSEPNPTASMVTSSMSTSFAPSTASWKSSTPPTTTNEARLDDSTASSHLESFAPAPTIKVPAASPPRESPPRESVHRKSIPLVSSSGIETISSSPPAPSPFMRPLGSLAPEGAFGLSNNNNSATHADKAASATSHAASSSENHMPVRGKGEVSTTGTNPLVSSTGVESISSSPPAPSPFMQGRLGSLAPPKAFGTSSGGEITAQEQPSAPSTTVQQPWNSVPLAKESGNSGGVNGMAYGRSATPSAAIPPPVTPKSVSPAPSVTKQVPSMKSTFAQNMKRFNNAPASRKDNLRSTIPNAKNKFAASSNGERERHKDSSDKESRPKGDRGDDLFAMRMNAFLSGRKRMVSASHLSGSNAPVVPPGTSSRAQSEHPRRSSYAMPLLTRIGPETMPSVALETVSWKARPPGRPNSTAASWPNELASPSERESTLGRKDYTGSATDIEASILSRPEVSAPQRPSSKQRSASSEPQKLLTRIGPESLSPAALDMVSWRSKAPISNMTAGFSVNGMSRTVSSYPSRIPVAVIGRETEGNQSVTEDKQMSSEATQTQPESAIDMPIKPSCEPKQPSYPPPLLTKIGPETLSPAALDMVSGRRGTPISNMTIGSWANRKSQNLQSYPLSTLEDNICEKMADKARQNATEVTKTPTALLNRTPLDQKQPPSTPPLLSKIGLETLRPAALDMASGKKGMPISNMTTGPWVNVDSRKTLFHPSLSTQRDLDIRIDLNTSAPTEGGEVSSSTPSHHDSAMSNQTQLGRKASSQVTPLTTRIGPETMSFVARDIVSWKPKDPSLINVMGQESWSTSYPILDSERVAGSAKETKIISADTSKVSSAPIQPEPTFPRRLPQERKRVVSSSSLLTRIGPETMSSAALDMVSWKSRVPISNTTAGMYNYSHRTSPERHEAPRRQTKAVSMPSTEVGGIFAYRMNAFMTGNRRASNRHTHPAGGDGPTKPKLIRCFGAETVPSYSPSQVSWKSNALEVDYRVIDDAASQLRKPVYPPP